jgi:hypothetical protein
VLTLTGVRTTGINICGGYADHRGSKTNLYRETRKNEELGTL